jgi:hypothetical protein
MSVLARVWQDGILNNGIDPRGHALPLYYEKHRQYGSDLLDDMGSVIWDGARMVDEWHWDWKSIYQLDNPAWQTMVSDDAGRLKDATLPPAIALTPEQQTSVHDYLALPLFDGSNPGITHWIAWSDGEPLLPIAVPLSKNDRDRVLELVRKRALEGPMPPDDERFTLDAFEVPQPPTENTPATRHVHYWDHERKKRQTQTLTTPSEGWKVTKAEQWNRDKNGWEDEGWDLGRSYTGFVESGGLAEIFAVVCTAIATVVTFGAGTPAALAVSNGLKQIGSLAVAQAHGQPVNAGDYFNVLFQMGKGAMTDEDVKAGLLETFSGLNASIQALYKDVTQSTTTLSLTEKIDEMAKAFHNVSTHIDVAFLQRIESYLPEDMKPAFNDGIQTFALYQSGKLDRFLTDKILKRGESELEGIYGAIFRVGYFQASVGQVQSEHRPLGFGSIMAMPTALQASETSQSYADALLAMSFPDFMTALAKRYRAVASSALLR